MSAHNHLQESLQADPSEVDPGAGKTLHTEKACASFGITTAAAEARVLPEPTRVGQEIFVNLDVDGGNLTVEYPASTTLATLTAVDDFAHCVVRPNAAGLTWRVLDSVQT